MSEKNENTSPAPAPQTDKPAKPKQKHVRLTPAQKREMATLWRTGETSLSDLEKRFNVSRRTVIENLKKMGLAGKKGELAKEIEQKSQAAMSTVLAIEPAVHAQRVFDTKNDTYRRLDFLARLTMATIQKAVQEKKPIGAVQNDIKTLKEAAATIKICREEAYAVLGISTEPGDDDDSLPELKIQELTPEDIRALRDQTGADDELDVPDSFDLPTVGGDDQEEEDVHVEGEDD